jgi:O-6-methylguanine DNA methyltransferase
MVYIEGHAGAVTKIRCIPTNNQTLFEKGQRRDNQPVLAEARAEIEAYFYHQHKEFSVPLDLVGSSFDKIVWDALLSIPYGYTMSYSEVAAAIGRPRAARAVGSACGRNPVWIIVPCHRVLGKDKNLRGYAGGVDKKRWLLNHEQCLLKKDMI